MEALRFSENLTLPNVIVLKANISCSHCRRRVSLLLSKMNGLVDYVVDVGRREVTLTGAVKMKAAAGRTKQRKLAWRSPLCGLIAACGSSQLERRKDF